MAHGEFVTDIKTADDALRAVRAVTLFCQENKDNIEKVAGLERAVADLTQAQRVLAESDVAAAVGRPGGQVGGTIREMVREYQIRPEEIQDGGALRSYTAGEREMKEEVGGIRLFGRSYEKDDGSGIEYDYLPGLLDDPNPITEAQRELQALWSARQFIQAYQRSAKPGNAPRTPHVDRKLKRLLKSMGADVSKAFADAAGVGAEWIPDDYIPAVETYVKHQRQVAALFRELPVTRDTSILPYLSGGFIPYMLGEIGGDDPAQIKLSSMSTASRTIQVKTLAVRTQIGDNAVDDTYLPLMELLMQEGGFALVSAEEDAIINGDPSATHQDTGLATWNPDSFYPSAPGGLSIDHRRSCKGLRFRGLAAAEANNSTDRSTFSLSTYATDVATIVGPKQGPQDMVTLVNNYILAVKILVLDQVVTREKYGDGASILTGEVARLLGRPIVPSQFLTKDLNTSGIHDAATTTKASMISVLTGRYIRPTRRGVTVEFQRDATRGLTNVVWKMRGLPLFHVAGATEKNVHVAYNMA